MRKVVKILAVTLVIALIGAAVTLVVLAQDRGEAAWGAGRRGGMMGPGTEQVAGPWGARGGVDEDGDGVCDVCGEEFGAGREGRGGTDEDGDGLCDICGEALGEGQQFRGRGLGPDGERGGVDEDGDGICDICGEACDAAGDGTGPRYGQQQGGRGMGRGMGRGRWNGQTQPQTQPEGQSS
jgi:hypothetical protein